VWLNLEYLSAEAWVATCHRQPSPHPRLPLVKYFFFPGFDAATGGLLREADYDARRAAFDEAAFRAEFGLPPRQADELTISMFAYPHAPALPELLIRLEPIDAQDIASAPGRSGEASLTRGIPEPLRSALPAPAPLRRDPLGLRPEFRARRRLLRARPMGGQTICLAHLSAG
jgi:hypothetical protein